MAEENSTTGTATDTANPSASAAVDKAKKLTAEDLAELKGVRKFGAKVKGSLFHGSVFEKVFKTGVGGFMVADGVRRAYGGVAGEKDPSKGEAEGANLVQLATGFGEAAAGLFLMQHGGDKHFGAMGA